MTPAMDFGGLGQVDGVFFQEGVALAPMSCGAEGSATAGGVTVMTTAGRADIESGALGGIIVPGAVSTDESDDVSRFDDLVRAAHHGGLPVMAFGDGVVQTLAALDYQPEGHLPPGVLVHNGVLILDSIDEVRSAIAPFHQASSHA